MVLAVPLTLLPFSAVLVSSYLRNHLQHLMSAAMLVSRSQLARTLTGARFRSAVPAVADFRRPTPERRQRSTLADAPVNALSAEDKLHVTELCYKFDMLINKHNQAALAELFVDDAEVHTPKASIKGSSNLVQYFKSVEPLAKGNRHMTTNILVEADPMGARAYSYRILHKACMPPALMATGTIEDLLVKQNGVWKFASRRFIMDPPAAPPAAA